MITGTEYLFLVQLRCPGLNDPVFRHMATHRYKVRSAHTHTHTHTHTHKSVGPQLFTRQSSRGWTVPVTPARLAISSTLYPGPPLQYSVIARSRICRPRCSLIGCSLIGQLRCPFPRYGGGLPATPPDHTLPTAQTNSVNIFGGLPGAGA